MCIGINYNLQKVRYVYIKNIKPRIFIIESEWEFIMLS